jgi:hypothetical protein
VKEKRIIGKFREELIKAYLDGLVYEKRGLTREQYIEKCQGVWNKVRYDPKYEKKVIIDFSQPVTAATLFGVEEGEVEFMDAAVADLPVAGFEAKRDIECLRVLAKRASGPSRGQKVPVSERWRPAPGARRKRALRSRRSLSGCSMSLGSLRLWVPEARSPCWPAIRL